MASVQRQFRPLRLARRGIGNSHLNPAGHAPDCLGCAEQLRHGPVLTAIPSNPSRDLRCRHTATDSTGERLHRDRHVLSRRRCQLRPGALLHRLPGLIQRCVAVLPPFGLKQPMGCRQRIHRGLPPSVAPVPPNPPVAERHPETTLRFAAQHPPLDAPATSAE